MKSKCDKYNKEIENWMNIDLFRILEEKDEVSIVQYQLCKECKDLLIDWMKD